ncbi:hypothetical protein FRB90_004425 [Tulasnella sp. 427]|nr:hypothetical protein FRB90_004425 [Tulasnella sp. 427]
MFVNGFQASLKPGQLQSFKANDAIAYIVLPTRLGITDYNATSSLVAATVVFKQDATGDVLVDFAQKVQKEGGTIVRNPNPLTYDIVVESIILKSVKSDQSVQAVYSPKEDE